LEKGKLFWNPAAGMFVVQSPFTATLPMTHLLCFRPTHQPQKEKKQLVRHWLQLKTKDLYETQNSVLRQNTQGCASGRNATARKWQGKIISRSMSGAFIAG
jgi:hypothetical protein